MKAEAAKVDDTIAATVVERRPWLSRKLLLIGIAGLLGLTGVIGGATWAFWPKQTDATTAEHKTPKGKKAKAAARKASEAADAEAAEETLASAETVPSAPPAPKPPAAPASAALRETPPAAHESASAPAAKSTAKPAAAQSAKAGPAKAAATAEAEDPMDKLRRRLAETLGANAVQAGVAGELRLVARQAGEAPAAPVRTTRPAARGGARVAMAAASTTEEQHGSRADGQAMHWEYEGAGGPQAWGHMKPEFEKCSVGKRQSPIDIRDGVKVELDPVQFSYQPSAFRVIDNGHTVQVNVAAGNFITVQGTQYELQQFHFHRPSEEYVNGHQYDMVAHLVHKDAQGRLAVIAVLLDRGAAQSVVQAVWNNLPLEKNEELVAQTPIDLNRLLPEDRRYYTYMGSLTTPPCSEGVLWMVMKHPMPISPEQIAIFSRLYPMNARPLQAASGRLIKESN